MPFLSLRRFCGRADIPEDDGKSELDYGKSKAGFVQGRGN